MHMVEALFLGLVQGLTEFLPVSSSAHLRIVGAFLPNAADPGAAFTAITQIGTETAVLVYFWRDISSIAKHWWLALWGRIPRSYPDARMGWFIILGSVPIVVLGLVFQDRIETVFRSLWLVAIMLIVFGIVLGLADWLSSRRASHRELTELTTGRAITFGFAQALALIPGVSRSGGTISAGLLMGFSRPAAARYAFLLAVPAVFGSGLYQLVKSLHEPGPYGALETLAATLVAFVVGLLVIALFMNWISRRSYLPFVIYRIVLGAALLVCLATGMITG
ncbi:MAG TPA: undecaprenyl-diphosphate phosphatase [Microbacteriaceae bacterium]|nr:undecaprenyl-diphosphate phosphatase [Microbacteriaceae bacterium]